MLNNSPNDTSVYDLIGETLIEDPPFFMNKVYASLGTKKLSPIQNQKMQQYILQKFSFFEKEAFVTASDGNVRQNKILIKGRFYITNYRIIAQGIMVAKTGIMVGLLGGFLGAAIQQHLRVSAYKGQQKILYTASEEKKACFGYQFPIFRAYNINRTISAVKYKVDTEFEHKGKVKKKTMAMTVTPKKNKGEKGMDFNVRKEEVLSKITELLNSNSVM